MFENKAKRFHNDKKLLRTTSGELVGRQINKI